MVDDHGRSVSKERAGWGLFGALITTYKWSPRELPFLQRVGTQTSQNPHLLKVPFVSRIPHWGPSSLHITWISGEQTEPQQHQLCSVTRWGM